MLFIGKFGGLHDYVDLHGCVN